MFLSKMQGKDNIIQKLSLLRYPCLVLVVFQDVTFLHFTNNAVLHLSAMLNEFFVDFFILVTTSMQKERLNLIGNTNHF